jgi:AcrR family transcriptional regulator
VTLTPGLQRGLMAVAGSRDEDGWLGGRWSLLDGGRLAAELERARSGGPVDREAAHRAAIARAALELSGEVGFDQMTVAALVERSGANRDRFYRIYADKSAAFTAGYEVTSGELVTRLLAAGADARDWPGGMRAALEELALFVDSERVLSRALVAEVLAAGEDARARRAEVFERLSRAIDRARRETAGSRHSPPPITSDFILSGIEASVLRASRLDLPSFRSELPGLTYMSVVLYFGGEVARAEVRRLGRGGGAPHY